MKQENKANISAIIQTLGKITVSGRDNLDMLLGCIIALEAVLKSEEAQPVESEEAE